MGFLKFLLAIALMGLGFVITVGSFLGGLQTGLKNSMFGQHFSSAGFWVTGIIGVVMFLGGIYMLRNRTH